MTSSLIGSYDLGDDTVLTFSLTNIHRALTATEVEAAGRIAGAAEALVAWFANAIEGETPD